MSRTANIPTLVDAGDARDTLLADLETLLWCAGRRLRLLTVAAEALCRSDSDQIDAEELRAAFGGLAEILSDLSDEIDRPFDTKAVAR
jgi:hypothetical protein